MKVSLNEIYLAGLGFSDDGVVCDVADVGDLFRLPPLPLFLCVSKVLGF
jgi:hypothetical protein